MAIQLLTKSLQRLSLSSRILGCKHRQEQIRMFSCSLILQRTPIGRIRPPVRIKKMVDVPKYTTDPIKMNRFDGRDEKGHRITRRGGGFKRDYYMIYRNRTGEKDGSPRVERVLEVLEDPNRSANIALVATGNEKRYYIATQNMKPGDLIKSSSVIPRMAVRAKEGDSHPLGALPLGTLVNSVEKIQGLGGSTAISAGVSAVLVRKVDGRCILKLPSKQEISVSEKCVATVGRVSNIDHNKKHWGKAGARRWAGFRPRSGLWQRKDGRFGRKIHPPIPLKVFDKLPEKKAPKMPLTIKTGSFYRQ